jgi:EAL domain-containing protein (putative c-di-GMP-specific phosphodiesterase class I)
MFRWEGVRVNADASEPPHVFVNTHPLELHDPNFIDSLRDLRTVSPRQPITLEIHESGVTDTAAMRLLRSALDELNIKLAYDDFGSGQDRLAQLFAVRPDYLKFDMVLIRNIDQGSPSQQKMLETLVRMVADLEIAPLAEGVETAGEDAVCRQIGFQLAQGFFYGKPAPARLYESPRSAT